MGSTNVWFNDLGFGFTSDGWRATAAHEIGHVFGLDEVYIESDFSCNPDTSKASVMDMEIIAGGVVQGGCDSNQPTSYDISNTNLLQQLNPMTQISSWVAAPGAMAVQWWDPTWPDAGYRFYAYSWDEVKNRWQLTGQTWLHTDQVGWAGVYNTTFYIKGSRPYNSYRVCGYTYNGVHGNQYWRCAPYQNL